MNIEHSTSNAEHRMSGWTPALPSTLDVRCSVFDVFLSAAGADH
jgi:hypothetical protein